MRHDSGQQQVGALCWRYRQGALEVLLVTSRDTGRWVIPKGWPMPQLSLAGTAAREAWEEAGVRGTIASESLGAFSYDKVIEADATVRCTVAVYALAVAEEARVWPERRERERRWLSRDKAARCVREPELAAIIAAFEAGPPDRGRGA